MVGCTGQKDRVAGDPRAVAVGLGCEAAVADGIEVAVRRKRVLGPEVDDVWRCVIPAARQGQGSAWPDW